MGGRSSRPGPALAHDPNAKWPGAVVHRAVGGRALGPWRVLVYDDDVEQVRQERFAGLPSAAAPARSDRSRGRAPRPRRVGAPPGPHPSTWPDVRSVCSPDTQQTVGGGHAALHVLCRARAKAQPRRQAVMMADSRGYAEVPRGPAHGSARYSCPRPRPSPPAPVVVTERDGKRTYALAHTRTLSASGQPLHWRVSRHRARSPG